MSTAADGAGAQAGAQMPAGADGRTSAPVGAEARASIGPEGVAPARAGGRRALAGLILLGAAGTCLALLASRQGWAKVTISVPPPLPASTSVVTGQDLYPAGTALALAALASLAALLATSGRLRRLVGGITATLGAGLGYPALSGPTTASVLAAVRQAGGPASGGGAGASAGSVTSGASGGAAGLPLAGFPARVLMEAGLWRAVVVAGGLALIVAGLIAVIAARRLPAMSARYDRSAALASGGFGADGGPGAPGVPGAGGGRRAHGAGAGHAGRAGRAAAGPRADAGGQAAMWDRLSAGEDPTS